MKQSTTGHKNRFGSIAMFPAFDLDPGARDEGRETQISRRPFHFEAGNIPIGQKISIKNKYLLGTSRKMIKNFVEISISSRRNIESLILTM